MRRKVAVGLVGIALSVALVSEALAGGAAPYASVADTVRQGESLKVTATNCESGDDWTAFVDVTIGKGEAKVTEAFKAADGSGTTEVQVLMAAAPGAYEAYVKCRHSFNDGEIGLWWSEMEEVDIEAAAPAPTAAEPKLTAAEKKKCKKKKTAAARRRCRQREAAD